MRETRILEFKETITNTFLKTVSAFSNYNGGTILFGVDDNGNVKGLFQEAIKKQDAEICDLKKDAADSHAKQKHYEEVLEAYSASRGDDYEA